MKHKNIYLSSNPSFIVVFTYSMTISITMKQAV